MKTPSSPALIEHLQTSQQFRMADLFTFTLVSGEVLRYTSWDRDVFYQKDSNLYLSLGPLIERTAVRTVIGVEVDTMDVSVHPSPGDQINGRGFAAAAARGALDGAEFLLERVFLDDASVVIGGYTNFCGLVGDIDIVRSTVQARIDSYLSLLNVNLPRNLYQPACLHTLYDAGCAVSRAANGVAGAVASGTTTTLIKCGLAQDSAYFNLGYIRFDSGDLAGTRRTVKSYTPGNVRLLTPLPFAPAIGDTFTAYPGCDKTQATCTAKFSNLANFRGMPYVPVPETTR